MYVKTSAKVVGVGALIGMPAMAAYHTITEAKAEDTEAEFRVGRAPYRPDALAVDGCWSSWLCHRAMETPDEVFDRERPGDPSRALGATASPTSSTSPRKRQENAISDFFPVLIVLTLFGFAFRDEMSEVSVDLGAHLSPSMTGLTGGIACAVPLGGHHGLHLGVAYARRGETPCVPSVPPPPPPEPDANADYDAGFPAAVAFDTPCKTRPELRRLRDYAELSVFWKMGLRTAAGQSAHLIIGPFVGEPMRCREENRATGARFSCSSTGGVAAGLVLGAELGWEMSERLDFTAGYRYARDLPDQNEYMSFLGGLRYRR